LQKKTAVFAEKSGLLLKHKYGIVDAIYLAVCASAAQIAARFSYQKMMGVRHVAQCEGDQN